MMLDKANKQDVSTLIVSIFSLVKLRGLWEYNIEYNKEYNIIEGIGEYKKIWRKKNEG